MAGEMERSTITQIVLLLAAVLLGGCADPSQRTGATGTESVQLVMLPSYHPERFACQACRIEVGAVVDVGEGVYGPYRLGNIIRRDRQGRFWMSRTYEEGTVSVYDSAGNFLTTVSKPGEGPGEMRYVSGMAAGKAGMYLADSWNYRLNVFNDSLRLVRMHPLTVGIRALEALDDGRLVAWSFPKGPVRAGFHILNDSGRLLSTVITDTASDEPTRRLDRNAQSRAEVMQSINGDIVIATGRTSEILTGNAASYTIKVIRDGKVVGELTSPVDWFDSYAEFTPEKPVPLSRMRSIAVDENNRAWVMFGIPNPSFVDDPTIKPGSDGLTPIPRVLTRYNTAIEVWDLNTGTLLTGVMVSPSLHAFADSRHVYTYIETASGDERARVWRLTLEE